MPVSQMADDDDFGDVVDFGDGAQYKIPTEPIAPVSIPPSLQEESVAPADSSESIARPLRHEYDRGEAAQSRAPEGKTLFNDRLGRFEPYARPTRSAKDSSRDAPAQVLKRPAPTTTGSSKAEISKANVRSDAPNNGNKAKLSPKLERQPLPSSASSHAGPASSTSAIPAVAAAPVNKWAPIPAVSKIDLAALEPIIPPPVVSASLCYYDLPF